MRPYGRNSYHKGCSCEHCGLKDKYSKKTTRQNDKKEIKKYDKSRNSK